MLDYMTDWRNRWCSRLNSVRVHHVCGRRIDP